MWRLIITIQDKILVAAISLELLKQENTRIYRQRCQRVQLSSPVSRFCGSIPHSPLLSLPWFPWPHVWFVNQHLQLPGSTRRQHLASIQGKQRSKLVPVDAIFPSHPSLAVEFCCCHLCNLSLSWAWAVSEPKLLFRLVQNVPFFCKMWLNMWKGRTIVGNKPRAYGNPLYSVLINATKTCSKSEYIHLLLSCCSSLSVLHPHQGSKIQDV